MKTILSPSQRMLILITSVFISICLISFNSHPFLSCQKINNVTTKDSIVPWSFPDISSIPNNEEGDLIRQGRLIFIHTYNYIGPDVKIESKRFAGTNMDCSNCHFKGGTIKNVLGLVGVYNKYPQFDPRSNKEITIQQRINSCLMRSMNGKPMPENTEEMTALASYIKWLSTNVPKGTKVLDQGLPKISLIDRAADTAKGRFVFMRNCTTCHAENGTGVLNSTVLNPNQSDSAKGYNYPPVMGNTSYNNGAGMYRLIMSTAFIYTKMPYNDAILSLEDAYDVAAYINSRPRSEFAGVSKDYPDLKSKPIDYPFGPYADNFTEEQHKYGPYLPMLKEGEKSKMFKPE